MYLSKASASSVSTSSTKAAQQQTKTITGRIVDAKGEALIGVTVIEKGTTNGAITDFDGNYSLSVADGAILQYSYVGYQTIEMSVTDKTVIDITMKKIQKY